MPLRLLEATIPGAELERIPALLKDVPSVHVWTSPPTSATGLVRVVLDARETEAVSDLLVQNFGSREGFRLILLSVEATVPAVAEEPEPEAKPGVESTPAAAAPQRISREELYEDINEASRLTAVFVAMVALSTIVAAVGLIRGDVAIIIGAMVIAPLLGPNIALSLASTLGDPDLARRSLRVIGAGVATAAVLSVILGTIFGVDPLAAQIAPRTRAEFGDIVLALAAGSAGALAFTSGVPAVVVGVMVAVALLPPLVVAGLLAGSGHLLPAGGAVLLALTNVTCINLAAVATFLLQRVRPRTWWEAERAKRATRLAATTWVVMLLLLLALMVLTRIVPADLAR